MKSSPSFFVGLLVSLILTACSAGDVSDPVVTIPDPTAVSSPTPTLPPTETPTPTPVPSGPCDNPLLSLRVGNEWLYQSTSPMGTSTQILRVTEWNQDFDLNAIIAMENLDSGITTSDWVTCREGGAIEDFPLFFISMQLGDYLDSVLNTYYQSGLYSPSYAVFAENDWLLNWKARYLTEEGAHFKGLTQSVGLGFGASSPIDLTFETAGEYEPVTVPAGTFPQALKIYFSFKLSTTISTPDLSAGAPLTVRTTQWYAPFIGLIRSQVDSATVELMPGQDSTAPLESVIELIGYTLVP